MKILLSSLFLLLFVHFSNGQTKNQERITAITSEISKAVDSGDYEKAATLKKEKEIREEIEQALVEQDFDKAEVLKAQLDGKEINTKTEVPVEATEEPQKISKEEKPTSETNITEKKPQKFFSTNGSSIGMGFIIANGVFKYNGTKTRYNSGASLRFDWISYYHLARIAPKSSLEFYFGIALQHMRFNTVAFSLNSYNFLYACPNVGLRFHYGGLFASLGGSLGMGIIGRQSVESSGTTYDVFEEEAIKKYNIGLALRFGYDLKYVGFYFEYLHGLTNIEGYDTAIGERFYTKAVSIGVNVNINRYKGQR